MTFEEFLEKHNAAGLNFFGDATIVFFKSITYRDSWTGDGYFITSE